MTEEFVEGGNGGRLEGGEGRGEKRRPRGACTEKASL